MVKRCILAEKKPFHYLGNFLSLIFGHCNERSRVSNLVNGLRFEGVHFTCEGLMKSFANGESVNDVFDYFVVFVHNTVLIEVDSKVPDIIFGFFDVANIIAFVFVFSKRNFFGL